MVIPKPTQRQVAKAAKLRANEITQEISQTIEKKLGGQVAKADLFPAENNDVLPGLRPFRAGPGFLMLRYSLATQS
jgi:hypothetical protein